MLNRATGQHVQVTVALTSHPTISPLHVGVFSAHILEDTPAFLLLFLSYLDCSCCASGGIWNARTAQIDFDSYGQREMARPNHTHQLQQC
jgi:hypothetical protein